MKKFVFIFALLIIIILVFVGLFRTGRYPVALVNGELIWKWQWEKEYQLELNYYSKAISTYNLPQISSKDQEIFEQAVLEGLISRQIIEKEFAALTGKEGEKIVDKKVNEYLNNSSLREAISTLFDLSVDEFVELVLVPRAKMELIRETLEEENRDFEKWFESRKEKAKIYIF